MFSNIVACWVGESICSRLAKDWSGCSNLPSDTSRVNKHLSRIRSLLRPYIKGYNITSCSRPRFLANRTEDCSVNEDTTPNQI